MATLLEKIENLILPPLTSEGYDIVRLKLLGNVRQTLQIMIERLDGVDIIVKDCEKASRLVSAILDVEEPLPGAYVLEVSSPGMDRPLVKPKDFKRFVGHAIKITLIEAVQNHKRFVAKLTSADDQGVQLSLLKEAEPLVFDILYGQIQNAKLYIDFDNYRLKGTSGDTSTH